MDSPAAYRILGQTRYTSQRPVHLHLQDLLVDNVSQHVTSAFDKDLQPCGEHGATDCHIQLAMGKHLLSNIHPDSLHALALALVDGHGEAQSDRELDPDHGPRIVVGPVVEWDPRNLHICIFF